MQKYIYLPLFLLLHLSAFNQNNGIHIDSLLVTAVKENNFKEIQSLIDEGANINAQDSNHASVLMWAAYRSDLKTVQYLVDNGADFNKKGAIYYLGSQFYGSLLCVAAGTGKLDMLKYFVETCKLDINDPEFNIRTGKEEGWTAISFAANRSQSNCVEYLLEKGAKIRMPIAAISLSSYYSKIGRHEKSFEVLLNSKEYIDQTLDKKNWPYISLLQTLSVQYQSRGDYSKAISLMEECVELAEFLSGRQSEVFAYRLEGLANLYREAGQYEKAEQILLKVKLIFRQKLGTNSTRYASVLNQLGWLAYTTGKYQKAIDFHLEVSEIHRNLSETHGSFKASNLVGLGDVYQKIGEYQKAKNCFLEASELYELSLGPENVTFAGCMARLGYLHQGLGDLDLGLDYLKKALNLYEKTLGKHHNFYISVLNGLGVLYAEKGEFEKALPLMVETLEWAGKSKDYESPTYGYYLHTLGTLYLDLGDVEKALSTLKEALINKEKYFGKAHPSYAATQNNLALVYQEMKRYDEAIELLEKGLVNAEENFGKDHNSYSSGLHNLGLLYQDLEDYEKALPLLKESLVIAKKSLGADHYLSGVSLYTLGLNYYKMGEYEKAIPYIKSGLENAGNNLGEGHYLYGRNLEVLGRVFREIGNREQAAEYFLQLNNNITHQINDRLRSLNDRTRYSYVKKLLPYFHRIYSFLIAEKNNTRLTEEAYNNQVLLKGLLLENNKRWFQVLRNQGDSTTKEQFKDWEGLYRQLAREYAKPKSERIATFDSLKNVCQNLEIYLNNSSSGFRRARKKVDFQEIQRNLRENEAVIEFSHFNYYNKKGNLTDSVCYVAYILRPEYKHPKLVYLFEEKELTGLFRQDVSRRAEFVADLYSSSHRGIKPINPEQKSLYDLIWMPLDSLLQNVGHIYFSPSGLLHRINIGAIPLDFDNTISDKYQLRYLGNTRSLVFEQEISNKPPMNISLWGGILFDMDSMAMTASISDININDLSWHSGSLTEIKDNATRGGIDSWNYLEWTNREIVNIDQIFKEVEIPTTLYKGYSASEEYFYLQGRKGKSPEILHIATHGYFFPDPKEHFDPDILESEKLPPVQLSEHPMVRSGLIMAGANHSWSGKPPLEGMEDGILTAYEISQLDLSNTKLVVLSACETGLGQIKGNEGVYGLQRAFKIAGVKYIIMSLWQVPDRQSSKLMTLFYTKWLKKGMPIKKAFATAQMEMRDLFEDPFFWAGFVLME